MIGEMGTISTPAIDLDRLPISLFSCFRYAGLLREQSQLGPRPGGFCQTTAFLSDPRRFLIVPFGFVPFPPFMVDSSELMPRGCFEIGLVQPLKQLQRSSLMSERRLKISGGQGERAKMTQINALSAEVASFLGNLHRRFVRLLRLSELAAGAKRIPELRTQRAPQRFDAVARRKRADDLYRIAHASDGFVVSSAHVAASTQSAERHGSAVARCVPQTCEDGFEYSNRFAHAAVIQ